MKTYLAVDPPDLSRAIHRVAAALASRRPNGVDIVGRRADADLVVLHAIGFPEIEAAVEAAIDADQEVIILQYCLGTTQRPEVYDWLPLWRRCRFVWSYFDLVAEAQHDGLSTDFDFYRAPLGVDGSVFKPNGPARQYRIGTSGYVAETEGVIECHEAARRLGAKQFHLGPRVVLGEHATCETGLDDGGVAAAWAACEYVAGLRRIEGFELPAAEGLACGARPILFDRPHYRQWFDGFGVFVPESAPDVLTEQLVELLARPAEPVTGDERARALEVFSWDAFARGFWERAL